MLSLSSIEILLGVGLVSILPLVFVVLRAAMVRVMQREEQQATSSRQHGFDPRRGAKSPLGPHIAASRARAHHDAQRQDRAA